MEKLGGFVLETDRIHEKRVREILSLCQIPWAHIGETTGSGRLQMLGRIDVPVSEAKHGWLGGLNAFGL